MQSAAGWTQTTYVDLHWLEKPWREALRRRYERALERAAPLVALALLPWIAAIAAVVTNRSALIWTLVAAPLLWAQAWLASLQLRLFVRGRFGLLARLGLWQSALLLAATFLLSRLVVMRGAELALLGAAVVFCMVFALRRILAVAPGQTAVEARKTPQAASAQPVPLALWTQALARQREPVWVGALALAGASGPHQQALTQRLEALAGAAGLVASAGPTRLLFFSAVHRKPERTALLRLGAGILRQVSLLGPLPDGAAALRALREQGSLPALPRELQPGQTAPKLLPGEPPGAIRIDLARGLCPPEVRALAPPARRRLYAAAERAARGLRRQPTRTLAYDVIADFPRGVLTGIALVPRDSTPGLRAGMRLESLRRALAP